MLELLYPEKCVVCGEILEGKDGHMCPACLSDMPLTYFWSWKGNPSEMILWGRTYFQSVFSLFFYKRESAYKGLIHLIKYKGAKGLGYHLGKELGAKRRSAGAQDVDFLVPVPLHWRKKWRRGYNQSEVIARGIADGLGGKRVETGLISRLRFTKTQTRITVGNKWSNVSSAFRLKPAAASIAAGKHILLVDDVLTTGATAEACYAELSKIPGVRISLATLAYVTDF